MAPRAAALALGLLSLAHAAPVDDLRRARTRVPRREYRGDGFAEMGATLTGHLRASFGRVQDCSAFSVSELLGVQRRLFSAADGNLLAVYAEAHVKDNRRERHESAEALDAHWAALVAATPAHALPVLRDALCHDVVMRFVHHTTHEVRAELSLEVSFRLPTLPQRQHSHDGRPETLAAFREYEAASGCQACHSRLVPPPSPELPADCKAQLAGKCGKRGQFSKDTCNTCVGQHASELDKCSPDQCTAFCDHPPACLGSDECPVWPEEFSSPFTLHSTVPYIDGAKCNFYYKYTADVQAQTVDYYEKCFPFVNVRTPFDNLPCKLIFNPQGIYLSQPGRVDCCKFVDGVGAAPPEFLQSFTLAAHDVLAPDMAGNQVKCDEWHGPSGFKYWTVGNDDALYKNFGHDIVFQDGPTGVTWRWGNFTVGPQDDSLFKLPAGDCEASCPKFVSQAELQALAQDPHVRRAAAAIRQGAAALVEQAAAGLTALVV